MKSQLFQLTNLRWVIPLIAQMYRTSGSKFVTLCYSLGVSRDSLKRTLVAAIQLGWVIQNPGHGHPMRPEYILTAEGERLGPGCCELMEILSQTQLLQVALQKWSLPLLEALAMGAARFSQLRVLLPLATSRSIIMSLRELEEAKLVTHRTIDQNPPYNFYVLTNLGQHVADKATKLSAVLNQTTSNG